MEKNVSSREDYMFKDLEMRAGGKSFCKAHLETLEAFSVCFCL